MHIDGWIDSCEKWNRYSDEHSPIDDVDDETTGAIWAGVKAKLAEIVKKRDKKRFLPSAVLKKNSILWLSTQ